MELDPSTRISQAQSAAAKAEREAAERVTEAQKRVREATREEEKQIGTIRDQYEKRTEAERARGENYIESVRNRNYENLTAQQRAAKKEENRIVRTSEKQLKDLSAHYEQTQHETVSRAERQLNETTKKNHQHQEHVRAKGEEEINALKSRYELEHRQIESQRDHTTATLTKSTQENREAMEEKTRTAIGRSAEHYQEVYEGAIKQNRDANQDLNWRAAREIDQLKRETAVKLDAYATQKSDPFYQMVDLGGELRENEDQFVFTAKVPEHERERINVTIRGNELVVSGKRRSEESVEVGPGRVSRTNSYQSFSESFPLGWPVNPKNMTREWDGETLVVRIPKRATYEAPLKKPTPMRAALERPKFPKNLPTEQTLADLNDRTNATIDVPGAEKNANTPPSKRKTGSSPA